MTNTTFAIMFKSIASIALYLVTAATASLPVVAKQKVPYPYGHLHLNQLQTQGIVQLDNDWKSRYAQLEPKLQTAQKTLLMLLSTPKSDPLEVTAAQQRVNHLKEQLSEQATANYLRKRRLLNIDQQRQLQTLLRQMLAERERGKS